MITAQQGYPFQRELTVAYRLTARRLNQIGLRDSAEFDGDSLAFRTARAVGDTLIELAFTGMDW